MEHRRREPAPGVFRLVLPLPFPGLERVNAYLLASDDGFVLVDCGIFNPDPSNDHGWTDLEAAIEAVDERVHNIDRLVVTHPHVDHYGMAGRLTETTGCGLWMHERCKEELDLYRNPDEAREGMRAMLLDHGVRVDRIDEITAFEDLSVYVSKVVDPTNPVSDGDSFDWGARRWEVIATPGHSRSHICLWDPSARILISGDHLLPTITPHIDYRRGEDDDPLGDFLASLERIEELDPALVLPGHGRPFEDGAARVRVVARHHDRRLGSILQVIRNQPRTADEITDEIFGDTLLHFQRRLALGEALAHLAYLRKRGEIERTKDDEGRYVYRKIARRR
jgi:glyoxylase-like metal-dependent hydrolase (beta-lactamase superfamily II)